MKRRILWIVLVLLLAGGLTGGYFYAQGVGSKPPFRTTPVTRGSVTAAVSAGSAHGSMVTSPSSHSSHRPSAFTAA